MKEALVAAYERYREHPTEQHRDLFLVEVNRYALTMYGHDRKLQPTVREDLAQEVTIRVWRYIGTFDGRSSIATWVHRICANLRCDYFKRDRSEQQIPEHYDAPGTIRDQVDELPAFLLDDPVAREIMEDAMTVANVQKKLNLSKAQYYRHLHALGQRMVAYNEGRLQRIAV